MAKSGKGEPITDPNEIFRLIEEKKSVYIDRPEGRVPAAVVVNWSFHKVMTLINTKSIFYYEPYGYHGWKNAKVKTKIGEKPILALTEHIHHTFDDDVESVTDVDFIEHPTD